jgi:hypothetical protein
VVDVDVLLGDAGAPQRVELVLDLPGLGPRSGGINSRQADVPPAEQMVFAVVRCEVEAIGTLIITQQLVERDLVDERGREWLASRR